MNIPAAPRALSITLRLSLLFAASTAAVLTIVGVFIVKSVERTLARRDLAQLCEKVELTRYTLAGLPDVGEVKRDPHLLAHVLVGDPRLHLQIESGAGPLYASSTLSVPRTARVQASPHDELPQASAGWVSPDGVPMRFVVAEFGGADRRQLAEIVVARDIADEAMALQGIRRSLFIGGAGGTLIAALLGWLVARQGLAPLRAMAFSVRGITAQRLHERLEPSRAPAELHGLAESFNAMLGQLEDSFRRLVEFSSNLAHELRTPINAMTLQGQVALSRPRTTGEYEKVIENGIEELERLTSIISDMLYLAKVENIETALKRERLDLAAEADRLIEYYGVLGEDRGVTLARRGAAAMEADRSLVQRALGNLVSNALRHAADGTSVTLGLKERGREVEVSVHNRGDIIPAEDLPRVFDRFYRADHSRSRASGGHGLGLAIVRSIVDLHGGEVAVTSNAAEGTTFTLRFPVRPVIS